MQMIMFLNISVSQLALFSQKTKKNGITLFFSLSDNKLAKISPDPQVKHEAKPCKQNTLDYHLNFGSLHVECYFQTWPVSQFYNVVVSIHVQWEMCSHLSK